MKCNRHNRQCPSLIRAGMKDREETQPTQSNVLDLAHMGKGPKNGDMSSHWETVMLWPTGLASPFCSWGMGVSSSCEIHPVWNISPKKLENLREPEEQWGLSVGSRSHSPWWLIQTLTAEVLNSIPQAIESQGQVTSLKWGTEIRIQGCRGELSCEDWEKPCLSGLYDGTRMSKFPKYYSWTSWLAPGLDFQVNPYLSRLCLPQLSLNKRSLQQCGSKTCLCNK